jgi:hypothetical protein
MTKIQGPGPIFALISSLPVSSVYLGAFSSYSSARPFQKVFLSLSLSLFSLSPPQTAISTYISRSGAAAKTAPSPSNIPPTNPSRAPSNIPLRTLPSRPDHLGQQNPQATSSSASASATGGVQAHHGKGDPGTSPRYSVSSDSDFSWSDTGDIGEQLADEEDPLRVHLPGDIHDELLACVRKPHKRRRVRILASPGHSHDDSRDSSPGRGFSKAAIRIPEVAIRRPTRAHRLLASIMGSSPIHGLTGKGLMYDSSSLCSLSIRAGS